ncbi:MAG TPA: polyprenyl synthetase family protein [Frankiaceae bacterium]|nr:polyprenyl synthetase family protein [Frankiaceae bacterium]
MSGSISVLASFSDPELEKTIRAGLADVERVLRESVHSDYPFVDETSRHLLNAGGKRFRPLVVLLASHFGDAASSSVVPAAVAIELTHLSTLYHDDVMDEATLRRGAPSANSRWNNTIAILTGDFLFARASEITADLGTEATRILARTIAILCEGQIRETVGPGDGPPVEHYLRVIDDKTGSLIATSGRLGAQLAGAGAATVEALATYGQRIGVAFQLSDDLLDITSGSEESGKTPGTDLREGIRTLPILFAEQDGFELPVDLSSDNVLAEALVQLRAHPALERARASLQREADAARACLIDLPDIPARSALDALCDVVVARTG